MQTRKLYYEDCDLWEFTATVLSCQESAKGFAVILDATAFYPEGGGQACDLGTLDGVAVVDVQEKGEDLLLPLDTYFENYPAYRIPSPKREARVRNGNPITDPALTDGRYRVYGADGTFLCLSEAKDGVLTAVKNFFGT